MRFHFDEERLPIDDKDGICSGNGNPAGGVHWTRRWRCSIVRAETRVRSPATGARWAQCCGFASRYMETDHCRRNLACMGWAETYRVGEASNPGPTGSGLSVTTGNGTGWGTILDWLDGHQGHVICAQEHRILDRTDVLYEKHRALAKGWKSMWSPAIPSGTAANEASGGTVVLVKAHIGVERPPGGEDVVPGRAAAAMIETAGLGWIVVYSVYGACGEDLGQRNWDLCQAIAAHAVGHGLPWIAAGDWNFEPTTLRASGWLSQMGAEVLAAPVSSTTHAGGRAGRHIDYFVAARSIAALGPKMTLCADSVIRTHDAIRMRLPVAPRQFVIRRLVRATVFPRELPIGPRQMIDTPAEVACSARAAFTLGERGDREAATLLVDEAACSILGHLENVLVEAYMIDGDKRAEYIGRAGGVGYRLGPLLGPKASKYGRAPPTVRRLRAVQDRAGAAAAALRRRSKRLMEAAIHLEQSQRDGWTEVIERARAAIHTGHHTVAVDGKKQGSVEAFTVESAAELKEFGKWVERHAMWAAVYPDMQTSGERDPSGSGKVPPEHDRTSWMIDAVEWAEDIVRKADAVAGPAEATCRNEKRAAVTKWAHEASYAGAAVAHRWTKVPEDWRPETVSSVLEGAATVTADPGAVVEAERYKWDKLWRPQGTVRPRPDWGTVEKLQRPTVEQFRRAARSFPRTTGIGVEGILPADFDALDDVGVDACIDVMMTCEAVGYIPKVVALVLVNMIPKKDGGRRPIGLLPSLYRIWAKVRRGEVRDWERKWARDYFAAGPGKAAETAAWISALRAELAAASGASSATVLWDLLKCFEHGQHCLLAEEAAAVKFPVAIARMSVEMYCAERRLIVDDAVSDAIHPTRGFMAGCARALALIKVVMVRRMDRYVARHPRVNLDLYVDDVELQTIGTKRIVSTMAAAVADLEKVLTEELGFPLAEEKSRVIASTDEIAEEIVAATDGLAGQPAKKAVKLGG